MCYLGRKEITAFFYIYMGLTMCSLILDSGVVPMGSSAFPYFVAIQNGLSSALCTCLMINGFVGFQLYEDGTTLSVWLLRLSSFGMFIISGAVSLLTFQGWGGLSPTNTVGMFVVVYILNALCIFVYLVMQIILVVNTLQDRWPLGHIIFGVLIFIVGQVLLYVFSEVICENIKHYLDGLFFTTFCNLLSVMMVYKVYFSILPNLGNFNGTATDFPYSIGIRSQRKILNFQLVSNRTTGKSKISYRKMNAEQQSTTTPIPTMQEACTTETLHTAVAL